MSIIEKAVERLDQLKRAGVDVPAVTPAVAPVPIPVAAPEAPAAAAAPAPAEAIAPPVKAEIARPPVAPAPVTGKQIAIDLDRLEAVGMVTPRNPRSVIAEEYRVIKRPLLRNITSATAGSLRHANLIMVSSSVPGEGKSFSSINLAMSLAMEMDRTVLLVDADVSRPSILNLLGLPPAPGLMDVLTAKDRSVALQDVLLRTNVDKLTLLPAGMPHQRATEFLASDTMAALVDEIATRYADRVVIFDSPPLLVTTEARVLATHMGQVVMVVESGGTTHAMVKQALATIEACPIKLMLLNKTREAGPGGYYGYGQYGYGQKPEQA